MIQLHPNDLKPKYRFGSYQSKKNKAQSLYLELSLFGKRYTIALGLKVLRSQWNAEYNIAIVSDMLTELDNYNNRITNARIAAINKTISEFISYLCNTPNVKNVESTLFERLGIIKTSEDIMQQKESKKINLVLELRKGIEADKDLKDGSKKAYGRAVSKLGDYQKEYGFITDYKQIDTAYMRGYIEWLSHNNEKLTIKYINALAKNILTVIKKYIVGKGLMSRNDFTNINIESALLKEDLSKSARLKNEIALSDSEVLQLYEYKCENETEEIVRDSFLLLCITGQRISDLHQISSGITEKDDLKVINILQEKTKTRVEFPMLFEITEEILAKYPNGLKKITNSVFNETLKKIARKAGINGEHTVVTETVKDKVQKEIKERWECVTPHTGRRTFITLLALRGYTAMQIKEYSGHSSTEMVELYAKLSPVLLEQYKRLPKEKKLKMLNEEEEREEPASKVVKQTVDNALFASDLLDNLIYSHNLGVNINKAELEKVVKILLNTSSLKKAVEFSQNMEKREQLKERVLGYKNIIWDICKRTYEVAAYRNYLIKLKALGFTEEDIYEEEMYRYMMETELREEDEDEWGRLSTSIGFPEEEREERTKY